MDNLEKFKEMFKYFDVLKRLFGDNFTFDVVGENIELTTSLGETYTFVAGKDDMECKFVKKSYSQEDEIEIYKRNKHGVVEVSEYKKSVLPSGSIIETIERKYGKSRYGNEDTLLDVFDVSYLMKGYFIKEQLRSTRFLEANCIKKTSFSAHMKNLLNIMDEIRNYTDTFYPSYAFLNSEDISKTYGFIDGIDKISIIYDLYCGNVNSRNYDDLRCMLLGLDDKNGFGLKYKKLLGESELKEYEQEMKLSKIDPSLSTKLITEKVGSLRQFNSEELSGLIELLNYELSAVEHAKLSVEKSIGMPYSQFETLDFDEQQKLIKQYHEKHPSNNETVTIMYGSGETATFARVPKGTRIITSNGSYIAGETPEEFKARMEKEIDDIINPKESIIKRVLSKLGIK